MSRKSFKQATTALLLTCGIAFNPASALAATTTINFAGGLPAGGTAAGGVVVVDGYQFASATGSVSVPFIGNHWGINFGYGLATSSYVPFSVSRVDNQLFSLEGFTAFVGNILVGGPTDIEITPFDMNGNELNPVVFSAGQFWTSYTKTGTVAGQDQFSTGFGQSIFGTASGPLSDLSKLNFTFGGADHFTAFSFSSVTPPLSPPPPISPASPVPEPETYAILLAGLGMLGFVARHRKQKAA
jgi:hypothetical protein